LIRPIKSIRFTDYQCGIILGLVTDQEDPSMTVFTASFRTASTRSSPSLSRRVWSGVQQALVTHRTRHLLAAMDDRMLSDIGVSRAEAGYEADRPIWDAGLR